MANKFQVKRTTVSGRTPNTTNSGNSQYIDTGELALNLTDGKMFSSNGTTSFEVGSNLVNQNITSTLTVNAISANGGVGTSGQVLKSNGTSTYWGNESADVGANGQILYRNSSNALTTSSGLQYDGTSIKVNGNLESVYQNGDEGGEIFLNMPVTGTSIASGITIDVFQNKLRFFENGGSNRGAYIDITAATTGVGSNLLTGGGGGTGTVTQVNTGNGLTGGPITGTGTISVKANTGIIANADGVFVDATYIGAINANGATYLGGNTAADLRSYSDTKAAEAFTNAASRAATAYANAQAYADLVSGTAYSNAIAKSANADNLTSGTVPAARLPIANTTVNGAVLLLDSVTNTSISTYAPTANSVKTAYDAAVSAYSNATTFSSNADNISSGTLNTARLPATANISTEINVGANLKITTGSISVGNSTINSVVNSSAAAFNTVNASSFTTTLFTANTTGIVPTSNTGNLGDATHRWNLFGNTGTFSGSVQIDGDLIISGNSSTITSTTLSVTDNMIYMNNGILADITAASGNGTAVVFTANNNFANGWDVFVSGVTPSSFNGTYHNITEANATHFIAANTNIDTYVSGGTARGKTDANPDIGFAAGYNDGTYHHTGFFRDATDGIFKVFDNYGPEPDDSAFIDTSNATFRIANLQANGFIAAVVNATTSVNSAIISVGTAFVANTTGAYHTGVVNAATISTSTFESNSTQLTISAPVSANGTVGTSGQVLKSNGTGVYWDTSSSGGSPGGANTQVQFNDSGSFNGTAGFTFNSTTNNLSVSNTVTAGAISVTNFIANTTRVTIDVPVYANGSVGSSGQVLSSNGATGAPYWATVSGGGGGGASGPLYSSEVTLTSNLQVNTGYNAVYVGPIILANGVGIEVANGSRLVIV